MLPNEEEENIKANWQASERRCKELEAELDHIKNPKPKKQNVKKWDHLLVHLFSFLSLPRLFLSRFKVVVMKRLSIIAQLDILFVRLEL